MRRDKVKMSTNRNWMSSVFYKSPLETNHEHGQQLLKVNVELTAYVEPCATPSS